MVGAFGVWVCDEGGDGEDVPFVVGEGGGLELIFQGLEELGVLGVEGGGGCGHFGGSVGGDTSDGSSCSGNVMCERGRSRWC